MEKTFLDVLRDFGCTKLEITLDRFVGDAEFYLSILQEMLRDPGFDQLRAQLQGTDARAAFETAHMLKGIISNCGITPMCTLIGQIVEPLRMGSIKNLLGVDDILEEKRQELILQLRPYGLSA